MVAARRQPDERDLDRVRVLITGAFHQADSVFVMDIYAASEKPIEGVTAETLVERIRQATRSHVRVLEENFVYAAVYLQEIAGQDFTAKHFRTWSASV